MLKYIFFDLDGTLLPMDQDYFIKIYFTELSKRFCPVLKLESEQLIKVVWKSTNSMIKNDGSIPNYQAFWQTFSKLYGKKILNYIKDFDDFYINEFNECKAAVKYNPNIPEAVKVLKNKGYTLVAATNPLFPAVATKNRIGWAGVNPSDFKLITTYENFSTCKPNPKYFIEIMGKLNAQPEECLMVGNDVDEDILSTEKVNIESYLVTDCIINRSQTDFSSRQHGSIREFLTFARMLPDVRS